MSLADDLTAIADLTKAIGRTGMPGFADVERNRLVAERVAATQRAVDAGATMAVLRPALGMTSADAGAYLRRWSIVRRYH